MKQFLAVLAFVTCTTMAFAQEPSRNIDDPRGQTMGFVAKPFVTGGSLPKYCTAAEWKVAIDATVAETKDIPQGQTAEFVRKANATAARFGC